MSRLAVIAICIACVTPFAAAQAPSAAPALSYLGLLTGGAAVGAGSTLKTQTGADLSGLMKADMSVLQITLGPCASLQPHLHPHDELAHIVSGTNVTVGVVYNAEDGSTKLESLNMLPAGAFAIFPKGQPHITQNEGCDNATVVATFNVATPELYFIPSLESTFPENTLEAAYGMSAANAASLKAEIGMAPVPVATLADCAARCNLAGPATAAAAPMAA